MTENELHRFLKAKYPKESFSCEWKDFKNLRHVVKGHERNDIIFSVSTIANVEGDQLFIWHTEGGCI